MKRVFVYFITALMLVSVCITGCSNDKETDSANQKGVVKEFTDKVAHEAVKEMTTPIDKAQAVKDTQEGGYSDMKKTLNE